MGTPSISSFSSTDWSVEYWPDLPFLPPFSPILSNRISPSCLGLPTVKACPASAWISPSSAAIASAN
jgi:hypothetical protein